MSAEPIGHCFHHIHGHIGPNPVDEVLDGITVQDALWAVKGQCELASEIEIRFRSERPLRGLVSKDFFLVFKPCKDWFLPVLDESTCGDDPCPLEIVPNGMDVVVFIPVGKRTEKGQVVWVGKVPYLVRLAIVNKSDGIGRHCLSHSIPLREELLCRFGVIDKDRERSLGAGTAPIAHDELAGQMVQGGSQIVHDVTDNNSDLCRGLLQYAYTHYLVSFLSIWIPDQSVGFRLEEGLDQFVKLVSMSKRPAYLQADTPEVNHGVMCLDLKHTQIGTVDVRRIGGVAGMFCSPCPQ